MKVETMELRGAGRDGLNVMHILVDGELLIEVTGYGTFEGTIKVCNNALNPTYDPVDTMVKVFGEMPPDGWHMDTVGLCLVWAEPITFAHAIMDVLNNQ